MRLIVQVLLLTPLVFAQNAGQQASQQSQQQFAIQTQQRQALAAYQVAMQEAQQASRQAMRNANAAAARASQQAAATISNPKKRPTAPFRVTHAPNFSPKPGTYTGTPPTVTITDASKGAVIYYTIDGSTPTQQSQRYAAPVALSSTTTLKAMAIAPSSAQSPTARGKYVVK